MLSITGVAPCRDVAGTGHQPKVVHTHVRVVIECTIAGGDPVGDGSIASLAIANHAAATLLVRRRDKVPGHELALHVVMRGGSAGSRTR
jgi:hypothetical protein